MELVILCQLWQQEDDLRYCYTLGLRQGLTSSSRSSITPMCVAGHLSRTATLARAESRNKVVKPFFHDPAIELLRKLGLEHEQRYLRQLTEKDGLKVVQIDGSTV